MRGAGSKNSWALFLLILAGLVLAALLVCWQKAHQLLAGLPMDRPLELKSRFILDLGILIITFGLTIKITISSIIGIVLAIIIYRFM